jgi:ABC-type sugar transport system, permease component
MCNTDNLKGFHMKTVLKAVQRILIILLLLFALLPLYVMLVGSLKNNMALFNIPPDILPFSFTLDNYRNLYGLKVTQWFFNSVFVSVLTTVLTLVVASCAAYSFAKKNFPGKRVLFALLLATMMIPRQILMVPTFVLIKNIGLYDNFFGLILPAAAAPFGVFLLKQFMQTLPNELMESSIIDGCSEVRTFISIVIPLSKPAIGALSIFVFISSWNDFMWQLVLLTKRVNWTLPLALANLMQEKLAFVGYQLAGATLATLPMVAIFLAFQSYFIKGITVGAVKG